MKRQEKRQKQQEKQASRNEFSQATASNPRQNRRMMALRKRKIRIKTVIAVVALGLLLLLGLSAGRIVLLKHELRTAEKDHRRYEEEKEQLQREMEDSDDLETLEEQARDQMRLIMPGETLYIFPEEMTRQ